MAPFYKLKIKQSAQKEIRAIRNKKERARIINRIEMLANNPRPVGCTKLTGQEAYRVRQGDYRIVYTVAEMELIVEVIKMAHRRDVYR